ncbi:isoprenylcysteine carboxylmethyltransferase family protein [Actinocorallia sp. A-T 12471]|uniref:methyltransferase family protein n=1 Tax=Actinocorallia sp. A-T 12471 TaxID=3089813 RepID=UPI0029CB445B|nr:isoprenylcysteine carboxylmethyltransferase family protein [Actinocorallia sp. A-T 12471]MDX6740846.1 isoprenylcysteine carboxylmethyltransferase family protein [Actinocorallia sp. A-T 12471]
MAIAALAIYVGWAAGAFGWRSYAQWRATGDAGFRAVGLRPGSVQWWVRVAFTGAILIGAAGPVAALSGLEPVAALDHPAARIAGTVVAVTGTLATFAAQAAMGASWRIGVDESERTDLVTDGPFALARNPIFTAMIVTAVGLAAMTPNPVSLTGLVLTVAAIELQVRAVEEPYLHRTHGRHYLTYASRVGRFLPRVGRLPNP